MKCIHCNAQVHPSPFWPGAAWAPGTGSHYCDEVSIRHELIDTAKGTCMYCGKALKGDGCDERGQRWTDGFLTVCDISHIDRRHFPVELLMEVATRL